MNKTYFYVILLAVSVTLLFTSSLNAQVSKKRSVKNTKIVTKSVLLPNKIAFQKSLQKLEKTYHYFLKNPGHKKNRLSFNKALDDAVIKAKGLINIAKEQEPQGSSPPKPGPTGGEQGPQGVSKKEITILIKMANSLLADLTKAHSISRKSINKSQMNSLDRRLKSIKKKHVNLVLVEPGALD